MGHNIDLCWLLGLPEEIECPRCRRQTYTGFTEYDIDCGEPNANDGKMELDCYCSKCEYDFSVYVTIKYKTSDFK